jgi:hypothetical protein
MILTGTLQGQYARRFPDFCYRKVIIEKVTPQSFDPYRLNWMNEFPRWSSPITPQNMQYDEFVDYSIVSELDYISGMQEVTMNLLPSQYRSSKKSVTIYKILVHYSIQLKEIEDYILKEISRIFS